MTCRWLEVRKERKKCKKGENKEGKKEYREGSLERRKRKKFSTQI